MDEVIGPASVERDIHDSIPDFPVESIVLEGEGDFCRAYTVNNQWIFRFAYNDEGSRSLEREIALLPSLVAAIRMPIPNVTYSGWQRENGLAFIGYPKIEGVELTGEGLLGLEPAVREECARVLAGFLTELHSFDAEVAREVGVPECDYPFCRTEEGMLEGSAADLYKRELDRLLSYPALDGGMRKYCKYLVEQLLDEDAEGDLPAALIHGDLSQDHVLFDPGAGRISGVIDFSDAIIGSPLLDFMYPYHAFGGEFLWLLLSNYPVSNRHQVAARVRLLHGWYIALRLLWALDHGYERGIEVGLRQLSRA
ncbi:MAG TPA: phosphotransferase [Chloroflexia bacterium]|nr:phosphotransferase [Chloroflexia bacterium]